MPLSSALQARLIERGILNASNINAALDASADNDGDDNEEIFAENYDERDEHQSSSTSPKKVSGYFLHSNLTSSRILEPVLCSRYSN